MTASPYSPTDYKTDLKPVWCPGCGDFAVLNSVYRALSDLHIEPHQTAIISGIGCSSRLPGYVETYGFNSLHGRALPLATGMKLAAPNLTVLAVGGDGDGLAIGGNHFMHAARRNVDIAYFMMDNEIYGLTKGQAAPTTPSGDKTKSTIYGNPEVSVDPCALAISLGASWVGRGFSGDVKGTTELMKLAISHHGFAFLNIISPCVTWRGDHQTKELRAKLAAIPADHDRADRTAALRFTSEPEHLMTTGVLYETQRPTLIDEMMEIRDKAIGQAPPPGREEILRVFAPAM
ncbi:MAG TPA: 2-oxoacid:ferredoxin oxidoreductase subunit beta [Thermoanaerobaculia bacterium]|jgi:2-oxoglutarate ferredoxin oxidoreductase subunit beta|nr:2-oxoacid:ferredoxin oxidoreductase subunit beta [Thermoanaerobaculia bacterium]